MNIDILLFLHRSYKKILQHVPGILSEGFNVHLRAVEAGKFNIGVRRVPLEAYACLSS